MKESQPSSWRLAGKVALILVGGVLLLWLIGLLVGPGLLEGTARAQVQEPPDPNELPNEMYDAELAGMVKPEQDRLDLLDPVPGDAVEAVDNPVYEFATLAADECDPYPAPEDAGTICDDGYTYGTYYPGRIVTLPDGSKDWIPAQLARQYVTNSDALDMPVFYKDGSRGSCKRRAKDTRLDYAGVLGSVNFKITARYCTRNGRITSRRPLRMQCDTSGFVGGWKCWDFNRRWNNHYFRWHGKRYGGWRGNVSYRLKHCSRVPIFGYEVCNATRYADYRVTLHAGKPNMRLKALD